MDNNLFSANVRWLIQVPRLYNVYKSKNSVKNFEEVIASKENLVYCCEEGVFRAFEIPGSNASS